MQFWSIKGQNNEGILTSSEIFFYSVIAPNDGNKAILQPEPSKKEAEAAKATTSWRE